MTVGNAILVAALMLSAVLLYGFTQDRWPWAKLFRWEEWSSVAQTGPKSGKPKGDQPDISFGQALGFVAMVFALALLAFVLWYQDYAERRDIRFAHEVAIGDPYVVVLQRQGVPDTIIVDPDENGFTAVYGGERAFAFSSDSLVVTILFSGAGTLGMPYMWLPRDGVTLGTLRAEVRASLGQPCQEQVAESGTMLAFSTRDRSVQRIVHMEHGSGRVVAHGWLARSCP